MTEFGLWNFSPPSSSLLGDHDVLEDGHFLAHKKVALLITGGIAAIKTPQLVRSLRKQGAEVVCFLSKEAERFVSKESLEWCSKNKVVSELTPSAEHLQDSTAIDAYLVAPATYNTINKAAHGIADGLITTTLASVLGKVEQNKTKLLVVPTMHGSMHNSILVESCKKLQDMGVQIISPLDKYGKHNLPEDTFLVAMLSRALSSSSLRKKSFLVTAGPTPVALDNVRRITNKFTGQLGFLIANELLHRGASVHLLLGKGGVTPPAWFPHEKIQLFEEYKTKVLDSLQQGYDAGIFSAAVADYKPTIVASGKMASGQSDLSISLQPTEKIIDWVKQQYPELFMVTFKYQENISHNELLQIGNHRLNRFPIVVANRGEEKGKMGEQIAWLLHREMVPKKSIGKKQIASDLVDLIEQKMS